MTYKPRIIDSLMKQSLSIAGAVLIEGVRACGKTETGKHHSNSVVKLDVDDDMRNLAAIDPKLILAGDTPRLIDEWQLVPSTWNHVRHAVDERRKPGQFILAGSQTPADDVTRHSGAGRILRLRMRPMTLSETGASNKKASFTELLNGSDLQTCQTDLEIPDVASLIAQGGWPALQSHSAEQAQVVLRSYLDDVARVDIPALDGVSRDPIRIQRALRAYARHISTPASLNTIIADTATEEPAPLASETLSDYLKALERSMVVEELTSWGPHLRSKDIVRKSNVRHFVDPSLAVAALGASDKRILQDPNTLGLLFESLVIRDLRVYAQTVDATVHHYRDSAGAEADAVIQLRDGRWAVIEVKLGANQVEQAAESLNRLVAKIDTKKTGEPAAKIVITASKYAYTRPDGVHVVPLACLGP